MNLSLPVIAFTVYNSIIIEFLAIASLSQVMNLLCILQQIFCNCPFIDIVGLIVSPSVLITETGQGVLVTLLLCLQTFVEQ